MQNNSNNNSELKNTRNQARKNKRWVYIIFILLIVSLIGFLSVSKMWNNRPERQSIANVPNTEHLDQDSLMLSDTNFINAVTVESDTVEEDIRVSNASDTAMSKPVGKLEAKIDEQAGQNTKKVYTGRRINIAIIGLDNRIGTNSNHADANHILSIMPDSGVVEITAIPRDTPANANMPDTSGQNKLTIVRAARGRSAYLKEVARIARLDRVDYYVEVGFSQVMGILELFGFKDSKSALQVLRSRKGLGGDDYQRTYNQAQFIRQMMMKHFSKVTGTFGDILIHGGLAFVETNLDAGTIKNIAYQLESKGFGQRSSDVVIRVRPAIGMKFKQYDLANKEVLNKLKSKIEGYNKWSGEEKSQTRNVSNILWSAIKSVEKDTTKNPKSVINKLRTYFDQKAWMQVEDLKDRDSIRSNLSRVLSTAYYKKKDKANAEKVKTAVEREKEMFEKTKLDD